jgi:putative ABC transport system permease protein
MAETGATAWRWLIAGEFRAFPMRFVLPGLAIAIGVALAFAVHVINRSAAESFGHAVRSAAGGADLQVRGASALGFDESLYPKLMAHSVVADASPVVQLRAIIGEQERPVPLLGLDIAHAALSDPARGRLIHDQRIARQGFGIAEAQEGDARIALLDWHLDRRADGALHATARKGIRAGPCLHADPTHDAQRR